jgi:dTDP-4-amino-4,6-dideoxygalactose transaminase
MPTLSAAVLASQPKPVAPASAAPIDFDALGKAFGGPACGDLNLRLAQRFSRTTSVRACADRAAATADLLAAQGARAGGVCIVSALAGRETLEGVAAAGLTPWLVDVDPFTWMVDTAHLRERMAEAPCPLEAIVTTCAFGRAPDLLALAAFQAETGLPVVVDAAFGFDVIMDAPVAVVVGLPGGDGVFVAAEDAALIGRLTATAFEGDDGLDGWTIKRQQLATNAQRLRMLLLGSPVAFQPGWGLSWVSSACVVSVAEGCAPAVAALLAVEGRFVTCVGVRDPEAAADSVPVVDHLAGKMLGLPFAADLDIADLDDLAEAVRRAVAQV